MLTDHSKNLSDIYVRGISRAHYDNKILAHTIGITRAKAFHVPHEINIELNLL